MPVSLDLDDDEFSAIPVNPYSSNDPIRVQEDELALKTNSASKDVFAAMEPNAGSGSLADRITEPTEEARDVAEVAAQRGLAAGFPHLSWEILKAGLMKETLMINELNGISQGIEGIQDKLGKILSLNQKITKLSSDKNSHPLTDAMKEDLAALKEMGFDLLSPDEKELSSEKLAMIKTDLDGIKSKLQTDMQTKFMNIQTKTSQYSSLLDSLKTVEKHFSRLLSTILQNMTKR